MNEITPSKVIPPAEEIDNRCSITGHVVNLYGNSIAEAEMGLYLDHDLIDTYKTDAEGRFSIMLDLEEAMLAKTILVEASYEAGNVPGVGIYSRYVRSVDFDENCMANLDYMLTNIGVEAFSNGDPLDSELISFKGKIVDMDGNGGLGALTVFRTGLSMSQYASYTNLNGYYEHFVYPGNSMELHYYTNCEGALGVTQHDPQSYSYFYVKNLTLTESKVLDDYVVLSSFEEYNISGTVVDCNGDPVVAGELDMGFDFLPNALPIVDGVVKFKRISCVPLLDQYSISATDFTSGKSTAAMSVSFTNNNLDLGEIIVCP